MIDLCQWRASIGQWNCCKWTCCVGKSTGGSLKVLDQSRISAEKRSKPTISLILFFTILLILAGDVELNPGPKTDPKDEVNRLRGKMLDVLQENYELLNDALRECLKDVVGAMFARKLITRSVRDSPTYESVIREFEFGLNFKKDKTKLLEHWNSFIMCLTNQSGPANIAGETLDQEWEAKVEALDQEEVTTKVETSSSSVDHDKDSKQESSDEFRLIPVADTPHKITLSDDCEEEIGETLESLNDQFVDLLIQFKRELKAKISRKEEELSNITEYILLKEKEDLRCSKDFEDLMDKLERYYDFLDCSVIVAIAKKFSSPVLSKKLQDHSKTAKQFRGSNSVKTLREYLMNIYLPYLHNMADAPKSSIVLNSVWDNGVIEDLKTLIRCFFAKSTQQSLLKHITITKGSVHIEYYMTEDPTEIQQIITHAKAKDSFMCLIGIYRFTINGQSILNKNEDENFTFELGLLNATLERHTEAVQFLLEMCDINYQRKDGATALMLASQKGYSNIVEILLTKNPHINTQGETGWTAFMLASRYNRVDVVTLLLERNPDINMQKPDGWTALMLASYLGHDEVVRLLLLQDKTFVNIQNNDRWTALMLAIQNYHDLPVKYLLTKQKEDVNLQNNKGMTALMLASVVGNFQVVELLLEKHVDSNIQSRHGMTALTITILYTEYFLKYTDIDKNILIISVVQRKSNYMKCLKLLFDEQTSPFFTTSSGEELPLILLATLSCNMDAIKIIMEKWPAQNEDILKAVVGACYLGHSAVITSLSDKLPHLTSEEKQLLVSCAEGDLGAIVTAIATGLNPDTSLVGGFTLLMIASSCGHIELVDAFIQSGADVDRVNDDGCTVFDILEETVMNKQEDIVSLLRQHKDRLDVTVPKQPTEQDTSTETLPAKIDQKAPTVTPEEVSTVPSQEQQTTPSPTVEPTTLDTDSKVLYKVSTKPDVVSKPTLRKPIIDTETISMFKLIVLLRQLPEVFDNTHTQPSNPNQACYTEHPQSFHPMMITT